MAKKKSVSIILKKSDFEGSFQSGESVYKVWLKGSELRAQKQSDIDPNPNDEFGIQPEMIKRYEVTGSWKRI